MKKLLIIFLVLFTMLFINCDKYYFNNIDKPVIIKNIANGWIVDSTYVYDVKVDNIWWNSYADKDKIRIYSKELYQLGDTLYICTRKDLTNEAKKRICKQ